MQQPTTEDSNDLVWQPNAKQSKFLEIPDSVFEALYGGAAFGGKSELLVNLPLLKGWHQHPRFKSILLRRTFPELEKEIIDRTQKQGFYASCGAVYNQSKYTWKFPSGAIVSFGHLEFDKDVRKYDSAEYNLIEFDELTSFTEYQYLYMFSRCRSAVGNLPAVMRSATNPGNIGNEWVRTRFVDPAPWGTLIRDTRTTNTRIFIQSFAQDNEAGLKANPNYLNVLAGMAEKDRKAKLEGDWYSFGGQVFPDFRDARYPGEPDNALHVVESFKIPDWWPRILCIDWGYNAMTYALWGAISPQGRLYLYREYGIKEAKISQWATEIGILSEHEKFHDIVICQSAGQSRGDDETIQQQFQRHSKLSARLSVNEAGSRVANKLILQDLMRWRQKPTSEIISSFDGNLAQKILRNNGLDAYKDYLKSFEPEAEESNIPKLQIFSELTLLRKAIPRCIYDDKKVEDIADFQGDDPIDTLKYMGRSFDAYSRIGNLEQKQEKLVLQENAVNDLMTSNDWTSYYRKMEHLEMKRKPFSSVRRKIARR